MIIKILRWILFIPILILCFYLIDTGIWWLSNKAIDFGVKWLIIFLLVGGLGIVALAISLSSLFAILTLIICPNPKYGGITFGIMSSLMCIADIYGFISYESPVFTKIAIFLLVLFTWIPFIITGFTLKKKK